MCAYIHTNMDAAVAIYLHGYVHICILHIWINTQNHVCLYIHKHTGVCMCVYTLYMYFSEVCVHIYIQVCIDLSETDVRDGGGGKATSVRV